MSFLLTVTLEATIIPLDNGRTVERDNSMDNDQLAYSDTSVDNDYSCER